MQGLPDPAGLPPFNPPPPTASPPPPNAAPPAPPSFVTPYAHWTFDGRYTDDGPNNLGGWPGGYLTARPSLTAGAPGWRNAIPLPHALSQEGGGLNHREWDRQRQNRVDLPLANFTPWLHADGCVAFSATASGTSYVKSKSLPITVTSKTMEGEGRHPAVRAACTEQT